MFQLQIIFSSNFNEYSFLMARYTAYRLIFMLFATFTLTYTPNISRAIPNWRTLMRFHATKTLEKQLNFGSLLYYLKIRYYKPRVTRIQIYHCVFLVAIKSIKSSSFALPSFPLHAIHKRNTFRITLCHSDTILSCTSSGPLIASRNRRLIPALIGR